MDIECQRGSSLIETAVAVAIAAIVTGAALNAAVAAIHSAGTNPIRAALASAVRREMTIAIDVLKYRGATVAPVTIATTLPMPAGSALPADLSIQTAPVGRDGLRVVITATQSNDARERASLTATLSARAPLPGAVVRAPALVPAPTGAP